MPSDQSNYTIRKPSQRRPNRQTVVDDEAVEISKSLKALRTEFYEREKKRKRKKARAKGKG